ncbi:phage tail fiber protein [Comamonas serinivorans]|nr:hypothetical protein [Comamonas serinivorans]
MKSSVYANLHLRHIFLGEPIPGLSEVPTVGPLTTLYMALHTDDPGAAGNQATNECNYTGYGRMPIPRDPSAWTVSGNTVSPINTIEFPEMTGGANQTAKYVTIGTAPTGGGMVLYRGVLDPNIPITLNFLPRVKNTSTITELTVPAV